MSAAREALVLYLTGPTVAHHSVCLQIGGTSGKLARDFFAVRTALGVEGYVGPDEARTAIVKALGISEGE